MLSFKIHRKIGRSKRLSSKKDSFVQTLIVDLLCSKMTSEKKVLVAYMRLTLNKKRPLFQKRLKKQCPILEGKQSLNKKRYNQKYLFPILIKLFI